MEIVPLIVLTLRMWPDPDTDVAWKKNVKDIDGELLCVSQFTLMANTTKGNKPDYHRAMASSSFL
jgi:D-tyrosyl-tRNA(Tyr) deacylase